MVRVTALDIQVSLHNPTAMLEDSMLSVKTLFCTNDHSQFEELLTTRELLLELGVGMGTMLPPAREPNDEPRQKPSPIPVLFLLCFVDATVLGQRRVKLMQNRAQVLTAGAHPIVTLLEVQQHPHLWRVPYKGHKVRGHGKAECLNTFRSCTLSQGINPILTGGGGQFDPPCTKSVTASRHASS